MGYYLLRRVLQAIPLLLVISFVLFALMNMLGDPLSAFAETRNQPSGKARDEIVRRLGLDKSISEQYIVWLIGNDWQLVDVRGDGTLMVPGSRRGVLRGDFGTSFVTRQPAIERIVERVPNTLLLMVPSYIVIILFALAIGVYSALRQYSVVDSVITGLSFIFYSLPIFFIALACVYLFGVQFKRWGIPSLPIGGMYEPGETIDISNLIRHMIMPVTCLIVTSVAGYIRFVRSSMLEVMNQDYIRTARGKGMQEQAVIFVHAIKNAALPLITIIALDIPFLLAGAVVTEQIFAWPGMGRLFIESLQRSDYSVLMAILMAISVLVVVFQLVADVLYTWLDPRIQYA
jgi:peptide/nickel transport system permease protein